MRRPASRKRPPWPPISWLCSTEGGAASQPGPPLCGMRFWMPMRSGAGRRRAREGRQRAASRGDKPFAHPYFWRGFIHTGY